MGGGGASSERNILKSKRKSGSESRGKGPKFFDVLSVRPGFIGI